MVAQAPKKRMVTVVPANAEGLHSILRRELLSERFPVLEMTNLLRDVF